MTTESIRSRKEHNQVKWSCHCLNGIKYAVALTVIVLLGCCSSAFSLQVLPDDSFSPVVTEILRQSKELKGSVRFSTKTNGRVQIAGDNKVRDDEVVEASFYYYTSTSIQRLIDLTGKFKNIRSLVVYVKDVEGAEPLRFDLIADKLVSIKLYSSIEKGTLTSLAKCKGLRSISLGPRTVDETHLAELENFPIENLDVSENSFSNSGLKSISTLENLRAINLSETQIKNRDFTSIANLDLHELALDNTTIEDADIELICRHFPNLRVLTLNMTSISSECIEHFEKLKFLEILSISDTEFSIGEIRDLISRLPKIQQLIYSVEGEVGSYLGDAANESNEEGLTQKFWLLER